MHHTHSFNAQMPCIHSCMQPQTVSAVPVKSRRQKSQHIRPTPAALQHEAAAAGPASHHGAEAVVLVDHGSKRAEANAMLEQFAELYRASSNRQLVRTAHMELAAPSIAETIAECAQLGASRVIVAPFFLSRGRHITEDIPALVRAAAAEHPELECVIADPLGTDELLAQLIEKRVQAAAAADSKQN